MAGPLDFFLGGNRSQMPGQATMSPLQQLLDPAVALPIAAQLMGNQGNMQNFGNAFGAGGQAFAQTAERNRQLQQQNKTYEFFKQNAPEFAQMIEGGMPVDQVWQTYTQQRFAKPTDTYRLLSDDEETKFGLPTDNAYQIGSDNRISQIGGGGTTVNMPKGESEYDKNLAKSLVDRFTETQKEGQTGGRALMQMDVMKRAMGDPGFYSGAGAPQVLQLKRWARTLGIEGAEGVDSIETFNAMAKGAALDTMGGSLGTGFSNADRDFVLDQVPQITNTPEGNMMLIDVQSKINKRKQEIAALARQYAAQNGGRLDIYFDEYLAQWADQHPLFVEGTGSSGGSPAVGATPRGGADPLGIRR